METVPILEKVRNLRGLGGLPAADGRQVARGRLFRSGSLHEATPGDRRALAGLGIRTVIDLRSAYEQVLQGYEWPGGRHVAAPLAEDSTVSAIFRRFEGGGLSEGEAADWWNLTGVFDIPTVHRDSVQAIFQTLLEASPGQGILLHCTGGKDRTGVAVAFILDALGVLRPAIIDDFTLTNADAPARAEEFMEWMRRATGRAMTRETAYWLAAVKPEWLETLLQQMSERYGSVVGYLGSLGFGPAEVAALRSGYLEPAQG